MENIPFLNGQESTVTKMDVEDDGYIAFKDSSGFLSTGYLQPEGRIAKLYALGKASVIIELLSFHFTPFPTLRIGKYCH